MVNLLNKVIDKWKEVVEKWKELINKWIEKAEKVKYGTVVVALGLQVSCWGWWSSAIESNVNNVNSKDKSVSIEVVDDAIKWARVTICDIDENELEEVGYTDEKGKVMLNEKILNELIDEYGEDYVIVLKAEWWEETTTKDEINWKMRLPLTLKDLKKIVEDQGTIYITPKSEWYFVVYKEIGWQLIKVLTLINYNKDINKDWKITPADLAMDPYDPEKDPIDKKLWEPLEPHIKQWDEKKEKEEVLKAVNKPAEIVGLNTNYNFYWLYPQSIKFKVKNDEIGNIEVSAILNGNPIQVEKLDNGEYQVIVEPEEFWVYTLELKIREIIKDKEGNIISEEEKSYKSTIEISELPLQLEVENNNPNIIEEVRYNNEKGQILVKFVKDWLDKSKIDLFKVENLENGQIEKIISEDKIVSFNIDDDWNVKLVLRKNPLKENFSLNHQIGTIVVVMEDGSEKRIPVVLENEVKSVFLVDKAPEIFVDTNVIDIEFWQSVTFNVQVNDPDNILHEPTLKIFLNTQDVTDNIQVEQIDDSTYQVSINAEYLKEVGTHEIQVIVDDWVKKTSKEITINIESPNQPPSINIVASATSIVEWESVTLTANASDSDGQVEKIEWYDENGNLIWEGQSITLNGLRPGTYSFYAEAIDNDGAKWRSNKVTIHVEEYVPPAPPNQPPSIEISANTTEIIEWESVTLMANASDSDGQVEKIEWYDENGNLIWEGQSITLNGLRPGTYSFYAEAIDNDGASTQSNQITVIVKSIEEVDQAPSIEGLNNNYTTYLWEDFFVTFQVNDDEINEWWVQVSAYIIDSNGNNVDVSANLVQDENGNWQLTIPADVLYDVVGGEWGKWNVTLKIVADDGIKSTEKTVSLNVEYPASWSQEEIVADEIWDWTPNQELTIGGKVINLKDYIVFDDQVDENIKQNVYFKIVEIEAVSNDIEQRKSFTIENGHIVRTWDDPGVSEATCLDEDNNCSIDDPSVYKLHIKAFTNKNWKEIPISDDIVIQTSIWNS